MSTLDRARVAMFLEPQVELRDCKWCGERQDAWRCKQRAEPDGIRWKCWQCGHLNSWKNSVNKPCQVDGLRNTYSEVA